MQGHYLSLRDLRIASTTGHVVTIKANEPTFIPEPVRTEAEALGCVPVDQIKEAPKVEVELSDDARRAKLLEAIDILATTGNEKDFTVDGRPRARAVLDAAGVKATTEEIQDVWAEYQKIT